MDMILSTRSPLAPQKIMYHISPQVQLHYGYIHEMDISFYPTNSLCIFFHYILQYALHQFIPLCKQKGPFCLRIYFHV